MGRAKSEKPKNTVICFRLDDEQTAAFDRKVETLGYPQGQPLPSRNDLARHVVDEWSHAGIPKKPKPRS
jgi:hypothetical protein